jgi:hypothetical protein
MPQTYPVKEVANMSKHKWKLMLGICVFCALSVTAVSAPAAVVVNFFPSTTSIGLGSNFDVDVMIFGLDSTDLAAYWLDIGFNDNALDYEGVSFGSELGYPDDSTTDVLSATGFVSIAEASELLNFNSQPDAFTLFTLTFSAQAIGSSAFSFLTVDLSDPYANPIAASGGGDVNVAPIPGAMWLLASGLIGLIGFRRRLQL